MTAQVERTDEIVITKPSLSMVILGTIASAMIVGPLAILVAVRMMQMKLAVTRESVKVVNFFSSKVLPLDEVRLVDESDQPPLLSDAGGPMDSDGRVLYLVTDSGKKANVGMVPLYGDRRHEIIKNLLEAIETMRAAA